MLKALFTFRHILISLILIGISPVSAIALKEKPIVITSQTLTANNKNNIAIFEGSVVVKNEDITIYSDKVDVYYNNYNNEEWRITKIHAYGNVRALKKEHIIFSKEAIYSEQERKIVFTGEPKAVEGENVITGTEIIYFLDEDRTIVKGSRVVLKKNQE